MGKAKFIPLLSGRHLSEYDPEGFRSHVKSLFLKRAPRKATKAAKKLSEYKVTARRLKKGKLTLTTKRPMKYVTEEEMEQIGVAWALPLNEVFLILKERDFGVFSNHKLAERVWKEMKELDSVFSGETL